MISFSHQIAGMPVAAQDGEIGRIADVLFDPIKWRVLYLEVATGWLFGRDVLVPVGKVTRVVLPDGPVHFDLHMKEIENSPAYPAAGRFDESYETELLGYYGAAGRQSEAGQLPPVAERAGRPTAEAAAASRPPPMPASQLDGYRLDADGTLVGTVRDIIIDLDTWRIISFTADVGGFLVPEMTEIGIGPVRGLDRDQRVLHVAIPKAKINRLSRLTEDDVPYVFPYVPPFM